MDQDNNELLLDIKDLKVVYKTDLDVVEAVNHIDLKIVKGRTLGLVGETGAGKTTTALSILRLLPSLTGKIESGQIVFQGKDLLQENEMWMRAIRGNCISMVFQDPMTSLNPVITVGEQISEVIKLHNPDWTKTQIEEKVDNTLSLVGIIPSRKGEYPHQFSGGMKQRVVIAIALCCEPDLLIADEPTTALDVTIQAQVLAMMTDLKNRLGTSMLMITHDLGIIAQTCDDVAVMYAGEIIETGSVKDIFQSENHHPYTKGLFDSIPNIKVKTRRLKPIRGLMADPTELPKGCYFASRCEHCTEICLNEHPELISLGEHKIRCHLYDNMLKGDVE